MLKPFSVDEFLLEVAGTLIRHRADDGGSGHVQQLENPVARSNKALEASERRSRELLAELLQAEHRERRRVAAEFHDDTLQVIVAGLLQLDRLEARLRNDERAAADIAEVRRRLSDAVDRARSMLFQLYPRDLDDHGLSVAIPELVERTAAEAAVEWQVEATVGRQPAAVEQLVFRTVREALVNVRKHARATRVAVVLREDLGAVCGSVIDDGIGFDVESVQSDGDPVHFGLHTLARRIEAAGGEVWVESGPGQGTALRFVIPADRPAGAR
jgi:signal transduction histidine kinase